MNIDDTMTEGWKQNENLKDGWMSTKRCSDVITDKTSPEGWKVSPRYSHDHLQEGWMPTEIDPSSIFPAKDTPEEVVEILTSPLTISDASSHNILPARGKPATPVQ